jgi:bifunctional DNA-binding transcriptional regulator/antitoxin component of YhaV-PrlF toxin-antitoxin module
MAEKELTKVVRLRPRGQLTIPSELRRRLKIDADSFKEGKIEIRPLRLTAEEEVPLREYSDEEIQRFLEEDRLDPETLAKVRKLLR